MKHRPNQPKKPDWSKLNNKPAQKNHTQTRNAARIKSRDPIPADEPRSEARSVETRRCKVRAEICCSSAHQSLFICGIRLPPIVVPNSVAAFVPTSEDAWLDAYRRLQPRWKSFTASRQMSIPISVSRVNQFDAARLDIGMSAMLKEHLVKVFSLMKVDKPTHDIGLMNLRYRDDRSTEARAKGMEISLREP